MSRLIFQILIFTMAWMSQASIFAQHIVRIQYEYQGSVKDMDIELFPDAAPLTVANFLDYVNSNAYDSTFIYRSVDQFVLQTGGYTFRPVDPLNDALRPISEGTGLERTPTGPLSPVVNEFNLSNTRGTVAMAKLPGQPDSATNEWFINLVDNSGFLDVDNGGFTVFGKVIDDGMAIADEIAGLPRHLFIKDLLGPAFQNMPVTGATFGPIYRRDMVMLNSFNVISRPVVRVSPESIAFGLEIAGDSTGITIPLVLRNTGDRPAAIGNVASPSDAQFTITSDNCSNTVLDPVTSSPLAECSIDLTFSAAGQGDFSSTILLPYSDQQTAEAFSQTYSFTGSGVPATPVLFSVSQSLNFPDTVIGNSIDLTFSLQNRGGGVLTISGFDFTGVDSVAFSRVSGCDSGTSLSLGQTCTLTVRFSPDVGKAYSASIDILSDSGSLSIPMIGNGVIPTISIVSKISLTSQPGSFADAFEAVTNSGTGTLSLSSMVISGQNANLFEQINNCPDTNNSGVADATLREGESCALRIRYSPDVEGQHFATLTISSNDPVNPVISIPIVGQTGDAELSAQSTFFVGAAQINGVGARRAYKITNTGVAALNISSITGLPAGGFSESNNCVGASLTAGMSCYITFEYAATQAGSASQNIEINSNDPVSPNFVVTLEAEAAEDTDGVPDNNESAVPGGDGNNDGAPDSQQNNVASFIDAKGHAVTMVSDASILAQQATFISNLDFSSSVDTPLPDSLLALELDLQSYSVGLPSGDGVEVAYIIPEEVQPEGFYIYGPTSDNPENHWFDFDYDASTNSGVILNSRIIIPSTTGGESIRRRMVIVRYVDGRRGDADLTANGVISVYRSGLVVRQGNRSGGAMNVVALLIILAAMSLSRIREVS